MAQTRAVLYIPKTQKGNEVHTYVGAADATTDAQYLLISAGLAGTDGALNGVICRAWEEITLNAPWVAGSKGSGPIYLGPGGTWSAPSNVGPGVFEKSLGAPIDDVANNLRTTTLITALPVQSLVNPDVARAITLTGNTGSSSVIKAAGLDIEGEPLTHNFTLNGNVAVAGTLAYGPFPITFSLVTAHTGDSFVAGVNDTLGLPVRLDNPTGLLSTTFAGVKEATPATLTFDASIISKNTVTLNSDLDGASEVVVMGIRSDAPLPFTSAMNR